VRRSFLSANARFDSRDERLAYYEDAAAAVFKHLMLGYSASLAMRCAFADYADNPAMRTPSGRCTARKCERSTPTPEQG
jgi:hypothetical protein